MNGAAVPLAHLSHAAVTVSAAALGLSAYAGPGAAETQFLEATIAACQTGMGGDAGNVAQMLTATGWRAVGPQDTAWCEPLATETMMWAVSREPFHTALRQDGRNAALAGLGVAYTQSAAARRAVYYCRGAQPPAGERFLRQAFRGPQDQLLLLNTHVADQQSYIGCIMGATVPDSTFEALFAAQPAGETDQDNDYVLFRRVADPNLSFDMELTIVDTQKLSAASGQDYALRYYAFFPPRERVRQ